MKARWGTVALAVAGLMFVLYPAVRPWHDETTVAGARASMSSNDWVAAHFFAMLGFIAVTLGLLAVHTVIHSRLSQAALLTMWIGAGLTLPYYGAEDFGLHAIARSGAPDLLTVVDQVRYQPLAATIFAAGLILLATGAILTAVAAWRTQALSRLATLVFALGFALFIPQFYFPAGVRIAHGVVVAIGCCWLAISLWTTDRPVARLG